MALPKVSTAGSFFTMAFFFTILCTPIASTIVETAASPSGIAATAKLTAVMNISIGSFPIPIPTMKMIIQMTIATIPNVFPNLFNFTCNGVSVSIVSLIIPAIFPTSVFIPVSTTTPFPLPYVIKLEENSIFVLSPIPTFSSSIVCVSFSTGTDSPVKDASCAFKFATSVNLISAAT